MSQLHIMVCSLDGTEVDRFELSVPVTAAMVSAVIVPAAPHGPWDVPCGHAECRVSLETAAACAEASERARSVWSERYDGWAE